MRRAVKLKDKEAEEVLKWVLSELVATYRNPSRIDEMLSAFKKYDKVIVEAFRVAMKPEFRDLVEEVLKVISIA